MAPRNEAADMNQRAVKMSEVGDDRDRGLSQRPVAETLLEAAALNREDPLLQGSLLVFPNYGQLVMTGDLHGHRRNFEKLRRFCDLQHYAPRHVILHEIIHEEVVSLVGRDFSHEVLIDAARWKCEFPDQVHFLLSNHELAQLVGNEISKNGRVVTLAFEESVHQAYGRQGEQVMNAIHEFIHSYPLAGRTPNRVMVSHSLPGTRELPTFDSSVLERVPTQQDLGDAGSAHAMVWGRYQTAPAIQSLREMFDVDYFVCGHQPQEMGYDVLHERMIILASDHNHGVFMTIDLSKPATLESLTKHIRPFASLT